MCIFFLFMVCVVVNQIHFWPLTYLTVNMTICFVVSAYSLSLMYYDASVVTSVNISIVCCVSANQA